MRNDTPFVVSLKLIIIERSAAIITTFMSQKALYVTSRVTITLFSSLTSRLPPISSAVQSRFIN